MNALKETQTCLERQNAWIVASELLTYKLLPVVPVQKVAGDFIVQVSMF